MDVFNVTLSQIRITRVGILTWRVILISLIDVGRPILLWIAAAYIKSRFQRAASWAYCWLSLPSSVVAALLITFLTVAVQACNHGMKLVTCQELSKLLVPDWDHWGIPPCGLINCLLLPSSKRWTAILGLLSMLRNPASTTEFLASQ